MEIKENSYWFSKSNPNNVVRVTEVANLSVAHIDISNKIKGSLYPELFKKLYSPVEGARVVGPMGQGELALCSMCGGFKVIRKDKLLDDCTQLPILLKNWSIVKPEHAELTAEPTAGNPDITIGSYWFNAEGRAGKIVALSGPIGGEKTKIRIRFLKSIIQGAEEGQVFSNEKEFLSLWRPIKDGVRVKSTRFRRSVSIEATVNKHDEHWLVSKDKHTWTYYSAEDMMVDWEPVWPKIEVKIKCVDKLGEALEKIADFRSEFPFADIWMKIATAVAAEEKKLEEKILKEEAKSFSKGGIVEKAFKATVKDLRALYNDPGLCEIKTVTPSGVTCSLNGEEIKSISGSRILVIKRDDAYQVFLKNVFLAPQWLESVTEDIDWSKVEKDTKVIISYPKIDNSEVSYRYFSHFKEGKIYCFRDGRTEWTAQTISEEKKYKAYEPEQVTLWK